MMNLAQFQNLLARWNVWAPDQTLGAISSLLPKYKNTNEKIQTLSVETGLKEVDGFPFPSSYLWGSHGLSARRTKSSRTEGPPARSWGPEGLQIIYKLKNTKQEIQWATTEHIQDVDEPGPNLASWPVWLRGSGGPHPPC